MQTTSTLPPDPLADILPSPDAIYRRLHLAAREVAYLRRLLAIAERGQDELRHRLAVNLRGESSCS